MQFLLFKKSAINCNFSSDQLSWCTDLIRGVWNIELANAVDTWCDDTTNDNWSVASEELIYRQESPPYGESTECFPRHLAIRTNSCHLRSWFKPLEITVSRLHLWILTPEYWRMFMLKRAAPPLHNSKTLTSPHIVKEECWLARTRPWQELFGAS